MVSGDMQYLVYLVFFDNLNFGVTFMRKIRGAYEAITRAHVNWEITFLINLIGQSLASLVLSVIGGEEEEEEEEE